MAGDELAGLTGDQLIERGAALETELVALRAEYARLDAAIRANPALLKPGIKLFINSGAAIAGLFLAPIALNWPVLVTAIGIVMAAWDALDFEGKASRDVWERYRLHRMRARIREIQSDLDVITTLLTQRLGPP